MPIAVLALASVSASGCWFVSTEIVTAGDSVKLAGPGFTMIEQDERTRFVWDDRRAAYVDPRQSTFVRFARFKGDVYIAQVEKQEADGEGGSAEPDARSLAVLSLRVAPPRLVAQMPECAKYSDDTVEATARLYGVAEQKSRLASSLSGPREGILGFLTAMLECDPETFPGFEVIADAISPGGRELAAEGVPPSGERTAAAFQKRCQTGELRICYRLAQMLQRGEGLPADRPRAAGLLQMLCDAPVPTLEACVDLAQLHDHGDGVPRDRRKATELLKRACAGGEMYGCDLLKRR